MKARIRKTGEIVEVIAYSGSTIRNECIDKVSWIEAYENYLGWVVNIDDEKFTMVFSNNLKYVHELQNAYYVSTGKELEIKL